MIVLFFALESKITFNFFQALLLLEKDCILARMNYRHFIITRFNLRNQSHIWQKDKKGKDVLTDEWMENRMRLFMDFCLPSVQNQSLKNFTWLVYIDQKTAPRFQQQFQLLAEKHRFIKIREVESYEAFQSDHPADILTLAPNTPFIITTRLDNDDLIHRQFVEKIQQEFDQQEYMAINFVKVLMFHPGKKDKLHVDYQFSNHFVSLIEEVKNGTIQGCYSKQDRFWDVSGKVRQIAGGPYCAELISGENLINDFRGFPVWFKKNLVDFAQNTARQNAIWDPYNVKWWKMSWVKFFRYHKLQAKN